MKVLLCCSYDHLVLLLVKIMDERPHDAVDVLEDMSLELKRALFKDRQSSLREHVTPSAGDMLAEHQLLLFKQEQDFNHEDPTVSSPSPLHHVTPSSDKPQTNQHLSVPMCTLVASILSLLLQNLKVSR